MQVGPIFGTKMLHFALFLVLFSGKNLPLCMRCGVTPGGGGTLPVDFLITAGLLVVGNKQKLQIAVQKR